jgi:hypothetical protein
MESRHPMVVNSKSIPAYQSLHFSCVPIGYNIAQAMKNYCSRTWPDEYTLEIKPMAIL